MYRSSSSSAASANSWLDAQSAVRGLTQDFATAFNTGNYDQAAALFTSDGFLMPPQRELVQGQKPIELMLGKLGEAGYQNLRLETVRVEESGDMAVEIGRYTAAVQQANGTTVADRGKFVQVWRRLGIWRMTSNCWNSDLAAVE
ncbi:MAG: nuclear transport factor 2 family protein [Terriglobales bacterium]